MFCSFVLVNDGCWDASAALSGHRESCSLLTAVLGQTLVSTRIGIIPLCLSFFLRIS